MFPLKQRKIGGYTFGQKTFYGTKHTGVDYEANFVPYYAPFDGVATKGWGPEGGNWWQLVRSNGDKFIARHLSKITKVGAVKAGDPVAITGNTGTLTTKPHLHQEVYINKKLTDPEKYDWEPMTFKLKLIANKLNWTTLGTQVELLKQRILLQSNNQLKLDVTIEHTMFLDIPYEDYAPNLRGIQRAWFKKYIVPKGADFHGVMLLLDQKDWLGSQGIEGYAYLDDSRPQEMQVTAAEGDTTGYPNTAPLPTFVAFAEHELCHTIFQVTGEPDITHDHISQGKFNQIASAINYSKLNEYLKGTSMAKKYRINDNGKLGVLIVEGFTGALVFAKDMPAYSDFLKDLEVPADAPLITLT